MNIHRLLNKLARKNDLSKKEAEFLMEKMLKGSLTSSQTTAILISLRMKGEAVDEIDGFVSIMRKYMTKVKTNGIVIDTCGTGGDGSGTFNISTATALVVAGAGVKVAKHGNRNVSSNCGSADVLEELGVNITISKERVEDLLLKVGIAFLFAPLFHPSMKNVARIRHELKIRTIFNLLGPLVNPAQVKRQLVGVANIKIAEKLAQVASKLSFEHLLIISSEDGLDEISILAKTYYFEVKRGKIREGVIDPSGFGFAKANKKDIQGGDRQVNAEIIKRILNGKKGPKRDIVLLNAAYAIYVSGKVKEISSGLKLAYKSIDKGRAKKALEGLIKHSQSI